MTEESKYGKPWNDDELDSIVADYFRMLADDLARRPYMKARYSAALMRDLGRSHRSVEFKHQDISAVLEVLGMPWIPGYVPKSNYQNAIFDAIDRYLTRHPGSLEAPVMPPSTSALPPIFVPAPIPSDSARQMPARLQRLVRKFDPVQRDYRNRALGRAGEAFVLEVERQRLTSLAGAALAEKVRWVADEDGDGAGYDILSFHPDGGNLLIEVKTTNGAARTPFFLTRNERDLATERPTDWRIYRVYMFANSRRSSLCHHRLKERSTYARRRGALPFSVIRPPSALVEATSLKLSATNPSVCLRRANDSFLLISEGKLFLARGSPYNLV